MPGCLLPEFANGGATGNSIEFKSEKNFSGTAYATKSKLQVVSVYLQLLGFRNAIVQHRPPSLHHDATSSQISTLIAMSVVTVAIITSLVTSIQSTLPNIIRHRFFTPSPSHLVQPTIIPQVIRKRVIYPISRTLTQLPISLIPVLFQLAVFGTTLSTVCHSHPQLTAKHKVTYDTRYSVSPPVLLTLPSYLPSGIRTYKQYRQYIQRQVVLLLILKVYTSVMSINCTTDDTHITAMTTIRLGGIDFPAAADSQSGTNVIHPSALVKLMKTEMPLPHAKCNVTVQCADLSLHKISNQVIFKFSLPDVSDTEYTMPFLVMETPHDFILSMYTMKTTLL